MADSNASGLCEEPDADFFDTFFDDGVLETIGEVLAEQKSDGDDDSSSVEEIIETSSPNAAPIDSNCNQTTLQNHPTEENHLKKGEKIIILKPAHIHDPDNHTERKTCSVRNQSSVNVDNPSPTTSYNCVQRNALKQLKELQCAKEVENKTSKSLSNETSNSSETKGKVGSVSMDELLANVSKFLKETPVSKEKLKDKQLTSNKYDERQANNKDEILVATDIPVSDVTPMTEVAADERKGIDSKLLSIESLPCTDPPPLPIEKNVSPECEKIEHAIIEEEEEGELKEDGAANSCILSTVNGCITTAKSTDVIMKTVNSKDESEKENDLTLEKTFQKSANLQSPAEKKTKISINLKSQLLASTTIINSASISKSSVSSTKQKKKQESSLSREGIYSSLSSLSDEPGPSREFQRERKKRRKKSCSSDSESSGGGRHKHGSEERRRKSRKRSKRDVSPRSRRKKESKKSKYRRSRSRSFSPYSSYRRKVSPKRSRHKRQRTSSRSPEPYRGRKSPSPSGHRRRRSRSRSRSRSPFINEISRLKRQWEREDKAKKSTYPHQPMPLVGSWPGETTNATSTTIVSNMLSVSGESLHVHSTSFTSIGAFPQGYQEYMGGLPSSYGPNHYEGAQYTEVNGGSYSGFPSNQTVPAPIPASSRMLQLPDIPGLLTSIPPPMLQAAQDDLSFLQTLDTSLPPPTTSVLRKQLDILKSTVASLPDPCVPPCKSANNSDPTTVNIPEQSYKAANEIQEASQIVIPTTESSISSVSTEKSAKNSTPLQKSSTSISLDESSKKSISEDSTATDQNCKNSVSLDTSLKKSNSKKNRSPLKLKKTTQTNPNLTPVALSFETLPSTQSNQQNAETSLQQLEDEVISVEISNDFNKDAGSEIAIGENSDSDVIIEDPPPKPPVELICLSPDEGDGGNEVNLSKECDENTNHAANDVNGEGDEDINNLYDLDKELDKIDKDMNSLREKSGLEGNSKRRRAKRRKRTKGKRKEIDVICGEKERTRKEKHGDGAAKLDDTENPVIKECKEMIDTLRSGRFVVNKNSEVEFMSHEGSGASNSLLKNRPKPEFSYTKKTNLVEISRTRNVSTNTKRQLSIDVCIGTDCTVIKKDAVAQTNLKCRGCTENKDLIEEMKNKILELERERDNLQAKLSNQSIPGLDLFSGSEVTLSSRESKTNQSPMSSRVSPKNSHEQIADNLSIRRPFSESVTKNKPNDPVVAFEYHHESPYLHSPF
ncbi:Serine/arginine-rich splicing factor RS31A [Frankliniella fusca]|uniref:Serine/arginine-rich splicing factor RS31A n=1 Tax=Frankliniella fusca TaxID=407009 RepID=A0AAE1LE92_9NEOP|nr:Serine/arginine-rich splicing factor RS31A [Frankliniella fusca]